MEPGPDIDSTLAAQAWPDLTLLVLVIVAGALARAVLAAGDGEPHTDDSVSTGGDSERTLALRMLWVSSIAPAFLLLDHLLPHARSGAMVPLAGFLLSALVLLVLVDALPARLGRRYPEVWRRRCGPLADLLALPLRPLARHLAARRAKEPPGEPAAADEEMLLHKLIDEAADEDANGEHAIDAGARELLGRVVRLRETTVRTVMQHREAVAWIKQNETLAVAADLFRQSDQARVLIAGRDLDDVLGVLHLKDLFLALQRDGTRLPLTRVARQASFVRDDLPLATLIAKWRRLGGSGSVVRDRHGRVVGSITLSDVLHWLLTDLPVEMEMTTARDQEP